MSVKKTLLLFSPLLLLLVGCENITVPTTQELLQECNSFGGVFVSRTCYINVVDYCEQNSGKSERDGQRNNYQREAYSRCVEINKDLFIK